MNDATTLASTALREVLAVITTVVDEHALDDDVAQTAADGLEAVCRKYLGTAPVPRIFEGRDALDYLAEELDQINADTNR